MGLGVEGADAFPSLLERGLPDTEVINAGVIGWGTAQEWLWLQSEGLAYAPDTLVLGFYVNDFWDNAGSRQRTRRPLFAIRGGELVLERPPSAALAKVEDPGFAGAPERTRAGSVLRFLRLHSRVARVALLGAEWLRVVFFTSADRTSLERADLREKPGPEVPPAKEVTVALLGRIRDACAARGIRLVVLVIPAHEDVRPELQSTARAREGHEAYDAAVRSCATLGIDAVGLRPRLAEMERSGVGGFHATDIHLNPAGHRAAADLLLARLAAPRASPVRR